MTRLKNFADAQNTELTIMGVFLVAANYASITLKCVISRKTTLENWYSNISQSIHQNGGINEIIQEEGIQTFQKQAVQSLVWLLHEKSMVEQ